MDKLGIGIVGVGRWGRVLLDSFSRLDRMVIAAHQGRPESASWLREHHPELRVTRDVAVLISDPFVRAVVIATPISTHFEIAKTALMAGKHVFLEKPGGLNTDEFDALASLAASKNLVLRIGYAFLYHPAFSELLRIHDVDPITSFTWLWKKTGSFGESLELNLLVHPLSVAVKLWGRAPSLQIIQRSATVTACDSLTAHLVDDEHAALIHIDRVSPGKLLTRSFSTASGELLVWESDTLAEFDSTSQSWRAVTLPANTAVDIECQAFLSAVRDNDASRDDLPLLVHRALSRSTLEA